MPHQPRLLKHHLPARHHRKVRNPSYLVSRRKLRAGLRVDLQHHCPPRQIRRRSCHLRSSRPARPAPRRPEVHQHRHRRTCNDLIEEHRVRRQRLSQCRQRSLARPTTARICQMLSRHPILLPALATRPNYRHTSPLTNKMLHLPSLHQGRPYLACHAYWQQQFANHCRTRESHPSKPLGHPPSFFPWYSSALRKSSLPKRSS